MKGAGIVDGPLKITISKIFGKTTRSARRRLGRVIQNKAEGSVEMSMFTFEPRSVCRPPLFPCTLIMNQVDDMPPNVILL
jgi:hypothetical protein